MSARSRRSDRHALVTSLVLVVTVLFILGTGFVAERLDIPVADLTRDPASTLGVHPFLGILSTVGILLWCATVAICLFSAARARRAGAGEDAAFLLSAGALTSMLLSDDLFMLHEWAFPLHIGVLEEIVYGTYVLIFLAYYLRFRDALADHGLAPLLLACACFATSILLDQLVPNEGVQYLVEDGFKLTGITAWFLFHTRACSRILDRSG